MRRLALKRMGLLALALGVGAGPATAGPLLDWLKDRRAEKAEIDDDGTAETRSFRSYTPPAGITVDKDLAYGPDAAHRLDVYRPPKAEGAPIVMMVHGGGWRRGDKGGPSMVGNKVEHWVGKGWVFVSINYRLVPKVTPVEQADDVGRALAFVQAQARNWGGDPARCIIMGHSAGAHLVSLVSSDGNFATRHGAQPWRATVAIDSAAFDIVAIMNRKHYGLYDTAFGTDPQLWRDASPLHRLKGKPAAPMLLVCSSKRDDSCDPAREFAAKATGFGGKVKVLPIALNHAKINAELGARGEYTESVDEFLRSSGFQ
jgi:arylformamidase